MGENSKIEWTNHTFNPWVGCEKVSQACTNCYAESWAKRTGQAGLWRGERRPTTTAYWRQPLLWQKRLAERQRETHEELRERVFCASLADVFEARDDLDGHRRALFELIARTPLLDWLLLTKRPEEILRRVPEDWRERFPGNVWVGTTVEDQQRADERIPHLLRVPARVRFLSMEPLLGPVDLSRVVYKGVVAIDALNGLHGVPFPHAPIGPDCHPVNWVIAGGESGGRARPSHLDWFRSLRDQCAGPGVPFHFKQWGEWGPESEPFGPSPIGTPIRVGKARAGRLLDGVQHDGLPVPR